MLSSCEYSRHQAENIQVTPEDCPCQRQWIWRLVKHSNLNRGDCSYVVRWWYSSVKYNQERNGALCRQQKDGAQGFSEHKLKGPRLTLTKSNALIDLIVVFPSVLSKACTFDNIRKRFLKNGLFDREMYRYPSWNRILWICKRNMTKRIIWIFTTCPPTIYISATMKVAVPVRTSITFTMSGEIQAREVRGLFESLVQSKNNCRDHLMHESPFCHQTKKQRGPGVQAETFAEDERC